MRLTVDLILRSPAFINAIKDRELDLRGNKIPFIENLGATQDQYDTLDLSDNEISKLENFPLLKRLRSVLLSNNRVSRIAANLASFLPNLETLILTNNRLTKLEDLDPLACLTSLRTLSLIDNPVTHQARYRLYVIHKLPRLRILDFRKIRIREKRAARQLYGDEVGRKTKKPRTFIPGGDSAELEEAKRSAIALKEAIGKATSMEEVQRLEALLASTATTAEALKAISKPLATSTSTSSSSSSSSANGAMHVE